MVARAKCLKSSLGALQWPAHRQAQLYYDRQLLWPFLMYVAMRGAQGLVQAVGVSNYGPRQLERIHAYLERKGVPLASAQARRSLCRRAHTPSDVAWHGVLDWQLGLRRCSSR